MEHLVGAIMFVERCRCVRRSPPYERPMSSKLALGTSRARPHEWMKEPARFRKSLGQRHQGAEVAVMQRVATITPQPVANGRRNGARIARSCLAHGLRCRRPEIHIPWTPAGQTPRPPGAAGL